MENNFRIGDRVIVRENNILTKKSIVGTIKSFENGFIGVELDKFIRMAHTLGGKTKDGYGYYFYREEVTILKSKKGNSDYGI